MNWEELDQSLLTFAQKLIHLRRKHPVFHRRQWFRGQPVDDDKIEDIAWFKIDGTRMQDGDYHGDYVKSFSVFMSGRGMHSRTSVGVRVTDDDFYIIFNASSGDLDYKLPSEKYAKDWTKILDTSEDKVVTEPKEGEQFQAGNTITAHGNSVVLLHHVIPQCEHLT